MLWFKLFLFWVFVGWIVPLSSSIAGQCDDWLLDLETLRNRDFVLVERFWVPFSKIEKSLQEGRRSPDAAIDQLIRDDARNHVFKLEALFRLYEKFFEEEGLSLEWRDRIKRFEDLLGAVADSGKFLKKAQQLNAPPEVQLFAAAQNQLLRGQFKKLLEKEGWLEHEAGIYKEASEFFATVSWPKQKEDREYLLKRLIRGIEKIEATQFDMTELQTGVHELRRQLRWILIDIQALRGKVVIDQSVKASRALQPYVNVPDEAKRFLDFEVGEDIKGVIHFPQPHYFALSTFVNRFGGIKDTGELLESLENAYLHSQLAKTPLEAQKRVEGLLKDSSSEKHVHENAKKAYSDLKKSGMLESLLEFLKSQL